MNADTAPPQSSAWRKLLSLRFGTLLLLGMAFINGFTIALGGLSLYESYQQHQQRARVSSQNIAHLVDEELRGDLGKIDLALLSVVDEVNRQFAAGNRIDGPALNKFLERLRSRVPEIDDLTVADADGMIRYGARVPVGDQNIADREYFVLQRDNAARGRVIANPSMTRIDGKWAVPISRRLARPDGAFAGVVFADISIAYLNKSFSGIDVGSSGSVALRNEALALVARHPMLDSKLSEIGSKIFFPEVKQLILAGQPSGTAISRYPADGIERTVSFRKISGYPFYVLIGLAAEDYLADWRWEATKTTSAVVIFFLITLVSGWWINRFWARLHTQQQALAEQAREIGEQVVALEQAALKTRKLAQAVEHSPAIVVITDVQGSIEYVNPKFTEVTGYTAEEALGQNPRILKSGLTPPEVFRELWTTILAGRVWHGELLNRTKTGSLIWENTWISPLTGEDGNISHFIVVKEDITQRKAAEAHMRMLSLALEHSPASVVITDREGAIEYVNPRFTEVSGYTPAEALGKTPKVLSSGLTPADTYQSLWGSIRSGREWSGELLNRAKNGELFWENERIAPITDHTGAITHFVALKEDITERKKAEAALHLSNSAIEASSNGIMVVAAHAEERPIVYVNPAFGQITGYDAADILGKDIFQILGCADEATLHDYLSSALRQHERRCAVVASRRKDGTSFWNEFAITVVCNSAGAITHYVGVISDVSARIEYEGQLSHQATHDVLTGLANRNLLMDRIDQAIANGHRYGHAAAVLLVDLDRFKFINDSMGHPAGDQVVQEVARRLVGCAREGDTVARMGGDEFVLVLNRVDGEQDVVRVLKRIVNSIAEPMLIEGRQLHITTSLGVSLFPKDGNDAETLLRYADTAMYRAKEQGRDGYWFYTADMNTRMMERLAMEGNLRHALENQEFVLHYQPQVDLRSGRIVGAEALIRWHSPTQGMVAPGKFIPLAEETGLIIPIGDWVLRSACQQAKRWQAAGLPKIRVAVNISALQFRQKLFTDRVKALLEESQLDATHLELEITESMLMHDVEGAIVILDALKALDLHQSLDDFGTGYSSLNYLKRFPIDVLKLDQSFVRDILLDSDDAAIANTVISLGHSLNLKVVAEGVETAEQYAYLQEHHCDTVQGYYFSRPLPADAFEEFLTVNERQFQSRASSIDEAPTHGKSYAH